MTYYAFDFPKLFSDGNRPFRADHIDDGLRAVPRFNRFAAAGRHIIRSIHAIPRLYNRCALGEVEVYIGRAGATAEHVLGRWSRHREEKRHRHGIVALICPTDFVAAWETAAVRAIKGLESRGGLCVKNVSVNGQGSLPATRWSCIYVTWKLTAEVDIRIPVRTDIGSIAAELSPGLGRLEPPIAHDQLVRALDPVTRPRQDCGDVDWHPDHV